MAVYFRFTCGHKGCGMTLVNDEKSKRYVHAGMAPERQPHKPIVVSKKMEEAKSA